MEYTGMVFPKNALMIKTEKEKVFEREIDFRVFYEWIFVCPFGFYNLFLL